MAFALGNDQRAKLASRKQANKKKNKNVAKDQAAQAQPVQASRDTAPKPTSASRKPSETPVKPAVAVAVPAPAPQPVVEELHVPMNGFNAVEVEAMLSAGAADAGEVYKPEKPTLKAAGVWGAKPGAMANGKDFWLELRKQVAELQANGVVSKAENKKQGG